MTWNIMITAMGSAFILTALISLPGSTKRKRNGILQGYLLANGGLSRVSVLNLLVSTSFGLNTLLYQGFLGATIGYWGLIVQAGWAAGFFLFRRYVPIIRNHNGLHEFLGSAFGKPTRVVAALFSLIGMTVFLGWETSIGKDAFAGILRLNPSVTIDQSASGSSVLVLGVVGGCLVYTLLGGLRGNGIANTVQNILKFISFGIISYLLWTTFHKDTNVNFEQSFFRPVSAMQQYLGWWGLITSIIFGFVWQFVDMSTWQNIAASSQSSNEDIRWNLKWSGFLVFITPGVLGTVMGTLMSNISGAESNILITAAKEVYNADNWIQFLFAIAMVSSVMSLIDGLFLASTYAIVVDILHRDKTLEMLDANDDKASSILTTTRFLLVGIAFLSVWGVPKMIALLGERDLFFFSFVVVIAQVALIGPIVVAIMRRFQPNSSPKTIHPMWIPILISGVVGFCLAFYGGISSNQLLTDSAATFTIIISIASALIVNKVGVSK